MLQFSLQQDSHRSIVLLGNMFAKVNFFELFFLIVSNLRLDYTFKWDTEIHTNFHVSLLKERSDLRNLNINRRWQTLLCWIKISTAVICLSSLRRYSFILEGNLSFEFCLRIWSTRWVRTLHSLRSLWISLTLKKLMQKHLLSEN